MAETDSQGQPLPPLTDYVTGELDRITAELPNWPAIAMTLAEHLKAVVAAWPDDITYHGPPVEPEPELVHGFAKDVTVARCDDRVKVMCGNANVSWSVKAYPNISAYRIVANAGPGAIHDLLIALNHAATIYPHELANVGRGPDGAMKVPAGEEGS